MYPLQQSAHTKDAATRLGKSRSRESRKDFTEEDYPFVHLENRLAIEILDMSVAQILAA